MKVQLFIFKEIILMKKILKQPTINFENEKKNMFWTAMSKILVYVVDMLLTTVSEEESHKNSDISKKLSRKWHSTVKNTLENLII